MALTLASTGDTVRTPSYTPTEGIGHSFPGAEILEFRDVQASLESVMPGCSLARCTHLHSYSILQLLRVSSSVTILNGIVSFAHFHKSEL